MVGRAEDDVIWDDSLVGGAVSSYRSIRAFSLRPSPTNVAFPFDPPTSWRPKLYGTTNVELFGLALNGIIPPSGSSSSEYFSVLSFRRREWSHTNITKTIRAKQVIPPRAPPAMMPVFALDELEAVTVGADDNVLDVDDDDDDDRGLDMSAPIPAVT